MTTHKTRNRYFGSSVRNICLPFLQKTFFVLVVVCSAAMLSAPCAAQSKGPEHVPAAFIPWTSGWVSGDPYQGELSKPVDDIYINAYRIRPKQEFAMKSLVLSSKKYPRVAGDHPSVLAPIDFAVGWGPMSDTRLLKDINVGQNNRWYYFTYAPASRLKMDGIYRHSGNMHMIPATPEVREKLLTVQRGDIVHVKGYLVDVIAPVGGWKWVSSISREDRGDGSCEVIYVLSVEVLKSGIDWVQYERKHRSLR